MPVQTLTTAGTRQAFKTSADWIVGGNYAPSQRFCRAMNVRLLTPGVTVYIGVQRPNGVCDLVSNTVYDVILNDDTPALPIGLSNRNNMLDLGSTWWDASANGVQIVYEPETI